jgi:hypothetical protein
VRQSVLDLVATLYRDATDKHGANWSKVEADVQARLEAMEPALKGLLMNDLAFVIAKNDDQKAEERH